MEGGRTQHRHPDHQKQEPLRDLNEALRHQIEAPTPELEGLEEGQLSGDRATALQPHLGNQAILGLLHNMNAAATLSASLESEEEVEQEQEVEVEEDLQQGSELRLLGGGGGGASGLPIDNPWELGVMFGGDDDPADAPPPRRRAPQRPVPNPFLDEPEAMATEAAAAATSTPAIDAALGLSVAHPTVRWGDSRCTAMEPPLTEGRSLLGRTLQEVEDLQHDGRPSDPIYRAAAAGRFLGDGRPLAVFPSLLRGPASALLTDAGGFAGAAARLATLALCAEHERAEGRDVQGTDRAVHLAMCHVAWPLALQVAREVAQEGRLHAPVIVARAMGVQELPPDARMRLPSPDALGGAALEAIIPAGFIPSIPVVTPPAPPPPPTGADDEALMAVDAMLARLTGGGTADPAALPAPPVYTEEHLRPAMSAANGLMNALGRAQVEVAAAAMAVRSVRADAPIRTTLIHTDKALRVLAQGVVRAGRTLESARGKPVGLLGDRPQQAADALRATADALRALRSWSLSTLAGALDAEPLVA